MDGVAGDWMVLRGDLQQLARVYGVDLGVDLANLQSAAGTKVGAADLRNLVKHINDGTNQYKKSLDTALDNSPLDGTTIEDEINRYIKDFRESTDRLENHYKEETAAHDAADVIRRAKRIDGYMRRYPISTEAQTTGVPLGLILSVWRASTALIYSGSDSGLFNRGVWQLLTGGKWPAKHTFVRGPELRAISGPRGETQLPKKESHD